MRIPARAAWPLPVLTALLLGALLLGCGGEDPTSAPVSAPTAGPTLAAVYVPTDVPTVEPAAVLPTVVLPEPEEDIAVSIQATLVAMVPTPGPTDAGRLATLVAAAPTEAPPVPAGTPEYVRETPVVSILMTPEYVRETPVAVMVMTPAPGAGEGLRPVDLTVPGSLALVISEEELACVSAGGLSGALESPMSAAPEQQAAVLECLTDEHVLRVFLGAMTGPLGELSAETSGCVRRGTAPLDLRRVMTSGLQGDEQEAMAGGMAGLVVVTACLSEEEFALAGPAMGMTPGDREAQLCLAEVMGGVEEVAAALADGGMLVLGGALAACALSPGGMSPGG